MNESFNHIADIMNCIILFQKFRFLGRNIAMESVYRISLLSFIANVMVRLISVATQKEFVVYFSFYAVC